MARIRTIKPSYWDDLKLAKVSKNARLLYVGMWNHADDLGVIPAEPFYIKPKVFPYDEDLKDTISGLKELQACGRIRMITYDGMQYYAILKFNEHQVINRPNWKSLFIPKDQLEKLLEKAVIQATPEFTDDSLNNHGEITDDSVGEGKGREGKGKEGKKAGIRDSLEMVVYPDGWDVEAFKAAWDRWKAYRKKRRKAWYKDAASESKMMKMLAGEVAGDVNRAIAAIDYSIVRLWDGIYEEKRGKNGHMNSHQQQISNDAYEDLASKSTKL